MQQPKRFQAPTLAEAYDKVRRELGDSAVILSTRKAFSPGLFGQPGRQFVEVVARLTPPTPDVKRPTLEQDAAAHDLVRSVAEATAAAPMGTRAPRELPATPPQLAAVSAGRSEDDAPWLRQVDEMRGMLEQLLAERMVLKPQVETQPVAASPVVASARPGDTALRDRLVERGLPAELATAVTADLDIADEAAQAAAVQRRLVAKMPPSPVLHLARRRAVFLVGPSGAGKTTLAVRLALQLEREQGMRVVIAGTDVNRAGGPQQLMAFGAVTGIETRLCYVPDDLEALLAEDDVDVVIVDTAGHTGQRRDRMMELNAFLQTARQRAVLLTLPATMKGADLSATAAAFGVLGLDGVAVTRCDETVHFGAVAGVSVEAALGVAFTTHSDQVSDAAAAGDPVRLASATLRGQWETETTVPSPAETGAPRRQLARVG